MASLPAFYLANPAVEKLMGADRKSGKADGADQHAGAFRQLPPVHLAELRAV